LANAWDFTADHRQDLISICAMVFIMTLGLIVPTRFYQIGEIGWHTALFVPVIFSATNLLFVVVLLIPLIVNLALWIFLITLGILIGTLIMTIFFRILAQ
jgi:hypothetical protein